MKKELMLLKASKEGYIGKRRERWCHYISILKVRKYLELYIKRSFLFGECLGVSASIGFVS